MLEIIGQFLLGFYYDVSVMWGREEIFIFVFKLIIVNVFWGPGIESRWLHDFTYLSRPILSPTQPLIRTLGTGSFPGVKRPGRGIDYRIYCRG
jgi:hypothetical protein